MTFGIALGTTLYSEAFDPDLMLEDANKLAANAYLKGCLEASKEMNGFTFTYKVRTCHAKAEELLVLLENLRTK